MTQAWAGDTQLRAVIDTGSQVTVGNGALRSRLFRGRRQPATTKIELLSGTGASATADLVIIPELRLGGIRMEAVPVAFADVPPFEVFGLADQPAVLLGTDLMAAFRSVSLDFRSRRVRFQLRRCQRMGVVASKGPVGRATGLRQPRGSCV